MPPTAGAQIIFYPFILTQEAEPDSKAYIYPGVGAPTSTYQSAVHTQVIQASGLMTAEKNSQLPCAAGDKYAGDFDGEWFC